MSDIIRWVAAQQQAERGGLSLSPRPGDFVSYPLPDDSRVSRPPSLTSCAWDSLAPGDYRGQGEVTYQVTPQGVADTATMTAVLPHHGCLRAKSSRRPTWRSVKNTSES